MRFATRIVLVLMLGGQLAIAQVNPFRPIPELMLGDGLVLKNFKVLSYTSDGVNASWDGGSGIVEYERFPPEWDAVFVRFRPKGVQPAKATTAPLKQHSRAPIKGNTAGTAPSSGSGSQPRALVPQPNLTPLPKVEFQYEKALLNRKIEGQCFIVTKGGQNVKLGLVSVQIFPSSVWEKTGGVLHGRLREYELRIKPLLDAAVGPSEAQRWLELYEIRTQSKREIWWLLPQSPISAKTDADGRFSITHDVAEKFFVVAHAARQVGRDVERYYWHVSSDEIPASGQLLLSNDNHH